MMDVARTLVTRALDRRAWLCRGQDLPSDTPLDLVSDKANRWNLEGEPTVYLSGDPALALLETGRHPTDLQERAQLFEVAVRIPSTLDLRDDEVRSALDLPDDIAWVLDRDHTRAVAHSLRRSGICDAILVPSAGALDQADRFNVVLFAGDRARVSRTISGLRPVGALAVGSGAIAALER